MECELELSLRQVRFCINKYIALHSSIYHIMHPTLFLEVCGYAQLLQDIISGLLNDRFGWRISFLSTPTPSLRVVLTRAYNIKQISIHRTEILV